MTRNTVEKDDNQVALTLKAPITTAADDIHNYFFIVFQRKLAQVPSGAQIPPASAISWCIKKTSRKTLT